MKQLHDYYEHILQNGQERIDRTGTGTIGIFGYQMRFDLREGFPLCDTKFVPFHAVGEELLWFLRGETNIKSLVDKNVNIWNADAFRWHIQQNPDSELTKEDFIELVKEDEMFANHFADLGDIYGKQWRSWLYTDYTDDDSMDFNAVDQIAEVIESIRNDPFSRRHIVSAWNPGDLALGRTALPPCHILFQFWVSNEGELHCQMYQRSADSFLGVPFNIASYSLLTHIIANETGLKVGEFVHTIGDGHIYKNHYNQVMTQLKREPRPLPKLAIKRRDDRKGFADYTMDDFILTGYDPHPTIKADVSVGK